MFIVDKPMPEGCDVCPCMYDFIQCNALPDGNNADDAFDMDFDFTTRPEWCPLKEQDVVQCKNCKWFEMPRFGERGFCRRLDIVTGTVWFCADGVRRE